MTGYTCPGCATSQDAARWAPDGSHEGDQDWRHEPEESAEDFLRRTFEFEACDDCGGDADAHDVIRLHLGAYGDGGWRTICRNPPDGVHCPHCGTPYDGHNPCRVCEEDVRKRSRTPQADAADEPPPQRPADDMDSVESRTRQAVIDTKLMI